MRPPIVLFAIMLVAVIATVALFIINSPQSTTVTSTNAPNNISPSASITTIEEAPIVSNTNEPPSIREKNVVEPISGFFDRITKKRYGTFVTPKNSPVSPERFSGYHTGADAETTTEEAMSDLPIFSMAAGTIVFSGRVNGYGGVVIIRHVLNNETVTALYGHLRISSIVVRVGDSVSAGSTIGVLGTGFTAETDGERKHLHLSLRNGTSISYRGYVQSERELSQWLNPELWIQQQLEE